jgi:hypothetical protein
MKPIVNRQKGPRAALVLAIYRSALSARLASSEDGLTKPDLRLNQC